MLSPEEYILDFKAEDKRTHSTVFDIEDIESDTSTISASEVNSNDCNTPTPPLLYKLRKARVMIKKLPRHILEKYDLKSNKSSISPSTKPARASKRMGAKSVPGLYLSLHVNKPLNEVMNKKKRRSRYLLNASRSLKQKHITRDKKSVRFSQKSYGSSRTSAVEYSRRKNNVAAKPSILINSSTSARSSSSCRNLHERNDDTIKINKDSQFIKPVASINHAALSSSSSNRRSLHDRIAATRQINNDYHLNKPVASILPNFPDVVITKYDVSTNNFSTTTENSPMVSLSNPISSFDYNQPVNMASRVVPPFHNSTTLSTRPQHNITIQVPKSYAPTIPNFTQAQSCQSMNAFPTVIMSAPRHLPMIVNSAATVASSNHQSKDLLQHQPTMARHKTIAVQTSTVTPEKTTQNDAVIMNSPKVLVIKQPFKRSDPLNMPGSTARAQNTSESQQEENEHFADSEMESCAESDSDFEVSDREKRTEPEVIKRIIYHTKSAQTKFTCNGTICGLVDSDEFNLNCFYCYEIFPLHKWLDFKEHIKIVHHVEEKENESDSTEDVIENSQSQQCDTANTTGQENSKTKTPNLSTKPLRKSVTLINKDNSVNEQVYKKLPLEPRLVAQRLNKMATDIAKDLSSSQKSPVKPIKQLNQSQDSNQTSKKQLSKDYVDDIISLDSDDGDDIEHVDDVTENVAINQPRFIKTPNSRSLLKKNNTNNNSSLLDEVAKLIPPHITIKKVQTNISKETANTTKSATEITDSLKEPFIKLPSNLNIQRVIKYIPKPTAEQLTANQSTRPRYFVVKKIVKPATSQMKPNINISKGTIITKMSESIKSKIDNDDMLSNDENEDALPTPTNGCGILFGLTNPMVVIEFLLKLKTFPELWRPQLKTNYAINCDESIKKLCFHLNNRFDLNIQDFEMRRSIQRVKDWYCRILKKIYEHNQNLNNTEPYKHKFPLYFKILNQFLTSDIQFTNNQLSFKPDTLDINKYPKLMETEAAKPNAFHLDEKVAQKTAEDIKNKSFTTPTAPSSTPVETPSTIDVESSELNMENLIEFDADTLYDDESSDEEILEQFDETKLSNKKLNEIDAPKKIRTKIYLGNYECDVCQKSYKRSCDLKRHKIHHFPPEFECGVCSQKFYFKHWAEKCKHLKMKQYVKKPYIKQDSNGVEIVMPKKIWPKKVFKFKLICEICGASYKQIGSLNCHKRDKHLNQRLKCVVCNFTALTNYRIVQHQKKRHIVEPGTVEQVAKRSRARMDTKTRFSTEARQEFDWRREMRKKLKPGEKFYACCKCRIIFNTRKEKVLHNKIEHPIKETTVLCLLCLPTKFLLSNSNSARRHYTDIHKVPWDEIDALVKRTKPIFNILSKEEIELLNASENYKELLEELIKDRELEPVDKIKTQEDEADQAVQNLPNVTEIDVGIQKMEMEYTQEENVFVDGIIDHDYNNEEVYKEHEYANTNEHDYSEEQTTIDNYDVYEEGNDLSNGQVYANRSDVEGVEHLAYNIECTENVIHQREQDEQEYLQSIVEDFAEGELVDGQLVEECIVVEECIDDVVDEYEYF
ncbi:uncharacterized protein LOC135961641 [Calliphora vicina]|uniref:uncharacterized protein LOC135961641 n=1 Tax=Calliphora vicina TaxID=7373 RepID=UPI00325BAE1D